MASTGQGAGPRLPRAQRREQIVTAATAAFARRGYSGTSLDDIAGEAAVTRVIVYRHFESKADLYRSVLGRARQHLRAAVGDPDYTAEIIDALVAAAGRDPDGFRLLFHHAAREPEFAQESARYQAEMATIAHAQIASAIPDPGWASWAAHLAPTATVAAITAWLDAGQPDPSSAAARIKHMVTGVVEAAQWNLDRSPPTRTTDPA